MIQSNILSNDSGRLRSGWRFLVFVFIFLTLNLFFHWLTNILFSYYTAASNVKAGLMMWNAALSLAAALLSGWFCARYLEGLPFRSLGLTMSSGWARNLGLGIFLGAMTVTLAVGFAAALPSFGLQLNSSDSVGDIFSEMLFLLFLFAVSAAFEEALFRGYMLQTFARAGLSWLAIVLTSIFFALVHLGNPAASTFSTANTVLAGIWFSIAYLKTRDLWFPIGMHVVWNWMQGSVFGIEVSGIKDLIFAPLMAEIDHGPMWITGGDYGIEGGIVTTVAITLSIAAIYLLPFPKANKELFEITSGENPATRPGS